MRGLRNLILEYEELPPEDRHIRVSEELTKLKKLFFKGNIRRYSKKKSIAKICFLMFEGCEIRFGFQQAIELVEEKSYKCRRIAWMMCILFMNTYPDCSMDLIPVMKRHLINKEVPESINLALIAVASINSSQLANLLAPCIVDIAFENILDDVTRKRALLTLARLYQTSQQLYIIEHVSPRIPQLMRSKSLGVALSGSVLALTIVKLNNSNVTENIQKAAIEIMETIILENKCPKEYMYKGHTCPFLISNLFRILGYRRVFEDDEITKIDKIANKLLDIFTGHFEVENLHTFLMIFSDAFRVFVKIPELSMDTYKRIINIFSLHLTSYPFFLQCLVLLIETNPGFVQFFDQITDDLIHITQEHIPPFCISALNLLSLITTRANYMRITETMIPFLSTCHYSLKEPICKNLATIIDSFANDNSFARDSLLKIVDLGDKYSECIWGIAAKALLRDEEHYKEVLKTMLLKLQQNPKVSSPLMKICAHVVGIKCPFTPQFPINTLGASFAYYNASTQTSIVSAMAKIAIEFPQFKNAVLGYLNFWLNTGNTTVLQRIKESLAVLTMQNVPQLKLAAPAKFVDCTINLKREKPKEENVVFDGEGITISAQTNVDATNNTATASIMVKNKLQQDLKIKKCDSVCEKNIKASGMISNYDAVVKSGSFTVVQISYVVKGPFCNYPEMEMMFSGKKKCRFQIPVSVVSFFWPYAMTYKTFAESWQKTNSKKLTGLTYLVVPDGDIIQSITKTVQKINLYVIKCDKTRSEISTSGYFKTAKGENLGILSVFTFSETEMILKCEVHSVTRKATSACLEMIKKAFSYS